MKKRVLRAELVLARARIKQLRRTINDYRTQRDYWIDEVLRLQRELDAHRGAQQ